MRSRLQKPLFAAYYRYCSLVTRLLPSITLDGRKIRVLPGIYKPLDNEHRVVDYIEPGKKVLDVGCGSGVITVFAALKSQHVTAVDISPQALDNTRLNCRMHGIENVTIQQSDMYSAVEGQFDYIVSYPPLFSVAFSRSDQQWCTSSYFVEALIRDAKDYLRPDGKLVVLLPEAHWSSPEILGEQNGLVLESASAHSSRPFTTRLHSIAYLHLNMNNHVFTFRRGQLSLAT